MPGFDSKLFVDLSEREAKVLNCGICLNIFDNAVNSECGHTFCKGCVQQWIESNHKECPECRKRFRAVLSSYGMTNSENLVIISNFVFIRNLRINSMVSELKTKCEFKGCDKFIEFGLLSGHLKLCEHRLCLKCGFGIGRGGEHNCLELMRIDRNEWKAKFNEMSDKNKKLEEELKTKRSDKTEQTINELKYRISRLKKEMEEMSGLMMDSNKEMLFKNEFTNYIIFGSFKCLIQKFKLNSDSIKLKVSSKTIGITAKEKEIDIEYDIKIPFIEMEELMYCSDPSLPAIIIKPNIETYHKLQSVLCLSANNSVNLELSCEDIKDWFIIIVFKETIKLFVEHFIRQQIEPKIKCESIGLDRTRRLLRSAENNSKNS